MSRKKLVLVTGSGRGLGATIAQTFADQNFQVAIYYSKSKDQAETLASTLGKSVEAFEADIKDRPAVEKMLESIQSSFGQTPNIIVNNAMTDYVFNGDLRQKAQEISWEEIQNHFKVGDVIEAKVSKITSYGAFVQLDNDIDGLVHISQVSEERVDNVKDVLSEGDTVSSRVIKIDKNERRSGLSIKAANYSEEDLAKEQAAFDNISASGDMTSLGDLLDEAAK